MNHARHKSHSSAQPVTVMRKIDEALRQFKLLIRSRAPWNRHNFTHLERQQSEYAEIVQEYAGIDLTDARAFEIGCGQRPYRLFNLIAAGIDAKGIDLDQVFLSMRLREVMRSFTTNGVERTAKSVARYILFDVAENRRLRRFLSGKSGRRFDWDMARIIHGDAASPDVWPNGKLDFVYSEDVFEHIPVKDLPQLSQQIANHLSPRGIAVIRPMVFTGIRGGHNVEWYNVKVHRKRLCPAWDHLRKAEFPANTYLNRVTLADYRKLFAEHFEILDEKVMEPNLGRRYMTQEIRDELRDYSDEELFSNRVRFVLRARSVAYQRIAA